MKVAILLPTLGREDKIAGLIENIAAATDRPWQLVFALDHDDTASWKALLAALPLGSGGEIAAVAADGTYPAKTNAAYRFTSAPLIVPTADDVVFHDGWLEPVLAAFEDESVMVVGTDDLSPMSNEAHATMPVIRRSYIEAPGCSFAEPGAVFSESYRHNYVETEVCTLAIHRGVWSYEPAAVIEHLHPLWGKRATDETDVRGNLVGADDDKATFERRRREWEAE